MSLKKILLLCCTMLCATAQSQTRPADDENGEAQTSDDTENPCIFPDDHRYCWTLDPITGARRDAVPDTSYLWLGAHSVMESQALAITYTGNVFGPHQVEDWFARPESDDFIFLNAYSLFTSRPERTLYFNTRIPYTRASYSTSGRKQDANERLILDFAGNFSRELGIGTSLDYVYARGDYQSTAAKPLKWTSYIYYEGLRYKSYLTFNISKYANQENGGIMDRGYVLTPAEYNDNFTEAANMPTNLLDTWNDTDHHNVHLTHSYDLGRWEERTDGDTATYDEFIPVATIFNTIDFDHYRHSFRMNSGADVTDSGYFDNSYISELLTCDSTRYANLTTYAGISLREGFNRWSQFGLSAFIGYERQSYTMMQDSTDLGYLPRHHATNNVWVGGQLSRHLSSILTFDVTGRTAVAGDKIGDVDITGNLQSVIPFGRRDADGHRSDSIIAQASGYVRNQRVGYIVDHYFSNHFRWSNDFDREQRVRIAGSLRYPRSGTSVSAGVEHINNYHYFSAVDGLPRQYGKQLDIFGLTIRQALHVGPLYWTGAVLFQTSTDDDVLALPSISAETSLDLRFTIAHTLKLQLGATGWWHSAYYAPFYQPATQTFQTQNDIKCGNFPVVNAYVNAHLKRIKFFVQMTNIMDGAVTNDAFLGPYYPIAPRRFMWGIVLDFQN